MSRKKSPFDFTLFIVIFILLCIGITMVFSASMLEDFYSFKDGYHHLKKQLQWSVLGVAAMLISANVDYRIYKNRKLLSIGMLTSIFLLIVVLFLPAIKDVHRWIALGPLTLQPSEIAKIMLIIYLSDYITRRGEDIKKFSRVIAVLVIASIFSGLIIIEPNMSTAVIVMGVAFCMLFISGTRIRNIVSIFSAAIPVGIYLMLSEEYRAKRFFSFLDPWKDPRGDGYQAIQSLLALGSGNIFGTGLGQSRQKFYYIPEAQNDFIFAIIGEEFGFLGCFIVIMLFSILVWRGIKISLSCKDKFGSLLAAGITSLIAIQSSINFLVVSSSMPVTGVTLPLISYGGSSLVITMYALGILLNISRYSQKNGVD